MFDEISEGDRKHSRADGVISKPLNEDEVLSLVNHLMKGPVEAEATEETQELIPENKGSLSDEMGSVGK